MRYQKNKTKKISFPLGGIGTGCIGLAGNGALVDWEIFNRPNKNSFNGYSHFAIRAVSDKKTYARVLQGDVREDFIGMQDSTGSYRGYGFGPHAYSMAGYAHFRNVVFDGTFPLARLTFSDEDFPLVARLRAFNPMIAHDEFNSSLPVAFFEWEIENKTDECMECAIAFSTQNPAVRTENRVVEGKQIGLFFEDAEHSRDEIGYSNLCILTDASDADAQAYWYRGGWMDGVTTYWKNFTEKDRMPPRHYDTSGSADHGTLVAHVSLAPHKKGRVRFVLSWSVPNQYNYWTPYRDENGKDITWKNHYATEFPDSLASARYAMRHFSSLLKKSLRFSRALSESTLPSFVIDALSSNLSVLKSPAVLRLEDGSLWAWEGVQEHAGSCEGSCQHVWNYAYALPFLFPRLERSLRENTLRYALHENGRTSFRIPLPLEREPSAHRPCVDGQMGEVIKCYREWKISGDDAWLRANAEGIFRMLEYAWSQENEDRWDADFDGVLEGRQHHTLDMELFGPSSWLQGFYLLALDCAAEMADALGESERSITYRALYEKGKRFLNEKLFNGSYFIQSLDFSDKGIVDAFGADNYWNEEAKEIKYQIGEGCMIDQMLADYHAALIGMREVFDPDKKRVALASLYQNNFKSSMREITNMWRNFAVDDEGGTVICTYPEGVRAPAIPISYCEECMTGFEYALAALMIHNGIICEGERIVRTVRERYDGEKRNPYNEIECGSNYARSMASFALLPIYSGFRYDMTKKYIGFFPVRGEIGRYFFSVQNTWGTVRLEENMQQLRIEGDALELREYGTHAASRVRGVVVDGKKIAFTVQEDGIAFAPVRIQKSLKILLI